MKDSKNEEISRKILEKLDVFDVVGIATKERFSDLEKGRHPANIFPKFESAIVFAEGNESGEMGVFNDIFSTIAAQNNVIDYLNENGFKAIPIEPDEMVFSLVRLGIEAGLGGISPVDSLVIEGLGLTGVISAILTDAKLIPSEKKENVCINCMKCLKVCPIRTIPNAKGDLSKCACGKCVNVCPV